jgi:cytochrome c5
MAMTEKHQTDHHDKAFFDTFMLVLGALGLITLAILFLAQGIHAETEGVYKQESEFAQEAVASRIAPVGDIRHAGDPAVTMGGGEAMSMDASRDSAGPAMDEMDEMADDMAADEAAAPATTPAPAPVEEAPVAAASTDGAPVYNSACVACHGAGIAGAPRTGDTAEWAPRLEQGMDVMYDHAIAGFQGSSGFMPPKGGNMSLSDDEVRAAVDFMVNQSQ